MVYMEALMAKINLHSHTTYCDGKNTPEEMVLAAMDRGFDVFGFSGHSYTAFDESYCMSRAMTNAYEQEVRRLASSYQKKLTILCGIEQDIFSGPAESRWDYAIGSVHAFYNREFDRYIYVDYSKDQMIRDCEECYGGDFLAMSEDYFATEATVIAKTGADIIGHFDLVTKFNEQEKMFEESHPRYEAAVDNALAKLLATGAVFEINTGAMSKGYRTSPYPSESILRKIKIGGGKIIISSDTHTADTIDFAFADAARLAKLCGFEKLDYPGRTVAL